MEFINSTSEFTKDYVFLVPIFILIVAFSAYLLSRKIARRNDNASSPVFVSNGIGTSPSNRTINLRLINKGERTEVIKIKNINKDISWKLSQNPYHTNIDNGGTLILKGDFNRTYSQEKIIQSDFKVNFKIICKHKNGKKLSYTIKGVCFDGSNSIKILS